MSMTLRDIPEATQGCTVGFEIPRSKTSESDDVDGFLPRSSFTGPRIDSKRSTVALKMSLCYDVCMNSLPWLVRYRVPGTHHTSTMFYICRLGWEGMSGLGERNRQQCLWAALSIRPVFKSISDTIKAMYLYPGISTNAIGGCLAGSDTGLSFARSRRASRLEAEERSRQSGMPHEVGSRDWPETALLQIAIWMYSSKRHDLQFLLVAIIPCA